HHTWCPRGFAQIGADGNTARAEPLPYKDGHDKCTAMFAHGCSRFLLAQRLCACASICTLRFTCHNAPVGTPYMVSAWVSHKLVQTATRQGQSPCPTETGAILHK
ncbi:MAG: hypothetical protein RSC58_05260, partial [Ruthenibacterium sp.]